MKYPDDFINKIICGDCLKIMKDIPDNSIDLIVTDQSKANEASLSAQELIESINKTGKTLLTHTTLNGKFVIRFCIGQRTTKEEHVRRIWKLIVKKAEKMLKKI